MSPASQTHTLHTHQRTDHAIQGADTLPTTHIRPSPSGPHGAGFAGPWRRPLRGSAQRSGWVYFGGIRIAPSRRIVSPLSMSFVMMLCTSLA